MGNAAGPHRGGIPPQKVALRDALRVYVWQHLNKYPQLWFSEVELARVVSQQYICEPPPPGCGPYHWGRSNAVAKVLQWLEERGEAVCRQEPQHRLWQAIPSPG